MPLGLRRLCLLLLTKALPASRPIALRSAQYTIVYDFVLDRVLAPPHQSFSGWLAENTHLLKTPNGPALSLENACSFDATVPTNSITPLRDLHQHNRHTLCSGGSPTLFWVSVACCQKPHVRATSSGGAVCLKGVLREKNSFSRVLSDKCSEIPVFSLRLFSTFFVRSLFSSMHDHPTH